MLNFGNKDFRNLQEQVLKNMDDIRYILEEEGVLNEFGIKVVGQVMYLVDLPSVSEYKAAHSDWAYGDAYAVGDEAPYELFILTRANGTHASDYWFEIGEFPVKGPKGDKGDKGNTGDTPSISVAANTTTLSAGQSASVSVVKSGSAAEPLLTFSFEIPQGAQGIQGIQGIQGPVGQQGPQGIQGAKGDPGYLYTIVGQVNDAQHLPLPTTVSRDAAFLVGTQEPYDVYVMIGQEAQELEWINLGEIATVIPNTYVISDTYAESGTVDANTLAAINNQTNMYYVRNGDVLLAYSSKFGGVAYFMGLGYNTGNGKTEVGRVALNLTTGAWTIDADNVPAESTTVTTNTSQTITGTKTFNNIHIGPNFQISAVGTAPNEYYSLLRTGAYSEGIFFRTDGIAVGSKLYPGSTGTYDLGSSSNKWKDLYLGGNILFGGESLSKIELIDTFEDEYITKVRFSYDGDSILDAIYYGEDGEATISTELGGLNIISPNSIYLGSESITLRSVAEDSYDGTSVNVSHDNIKVSNGQLVSDNTIVAKKDIKFANNTLITPVPYADANGEPVYDSSNPSEYSLQVKIILKDNADHRYDKTTTLKLSSNGVAIAPKGGFGYYRDSGFQSIGNYTAEFPNYIKINKSECLDIYNNIINATSSLYAKIEVVSNGTYIMTGDSFVVPYIAIETRRYNSNRNDGAGGVLTVNEIDGPQAQLSFSSFPTGYTESTTPGFIIGLRSVKYGSTTALTYINNIYTDMFAEMNDW